MDAGRERDRERWRPGRRVHWGALVGNWLPVLLWMGVIFWFSAQSQLPRSPDPLIEVIVKKGAHAGEYAILGLLLARALSAGRLHEGSVQLLVMAWVVVVIYAASDEFHQSFTPGRTPSPVDVLIDATGAMVALVAVRWWLRNRRLGDPSLPRDTR